MKRPLQLGLSLQVPESGFSGQESSSRTTSGELIIDAVPRLREILTGKPLAVLVKDGCCMGMVAKNILIGNGVNPEIVAVDDVVEDIVLGRLRAISQSLNEDPGHGKAAMVTLPLIIVGGKVLGGLDELMQAHISGTLIPLLRQAKALWL